MPTKGGKVDDDRVKTAVLLLLFTCVGLNPAGQAFQVKDNSSCHNSGCYNSDHRNSCHNMTLGRCSGAVSCARSGDDDQGIFLLHLGPAGC